jgi:6,7-dimethyl-8-ribityllumazine synthase
LSRAAAGTIHRDAQGAASRGRPFLAPLGNLEFVDGALPTLNTDLLIEVTALDALHQVARRWLETNAGADTGETSITSIEDTHWKSRLFTVQPVPGFTVAFWEHQDPLAATPSRSKATSAPKA